MMSPILQPRTSSRARSLWQRLARFLAPPYFPDDPEKSQRARVLNSVFWVLLLGVSLSLAGLVVDPRPPRQDALIFLLFALALIPVRLALARGAVQLASILLLFVAYIAITLSSIELGGVETPFTVAYVGWIVAAGLLFSQRAMVASVVVVSCSVLGIEGLEDLGVITAQHPTSHLQQWLIYTAVFTASSSIVWLTLADLARALAQARHELQTKEIAQTALAELNQELETRVATRTRELDHANLQLAAQVQLLRESVIRVEALYGISQNLVADKTLRELLQDVADTLMRALPANRVALAIMHITHKQVEHFIKSGPGAADIVEETFDELWEGLSGWALRERQPALSPKEIADPRESPDAQKRRVETHCGAILVAPLIYQEKLLGALTAINRPDERDFERADLELMRVIANQAAATVERTRNQEILRYQNEFLSALNHITLDLLNHREVDELLNAIVQEAAKLLDAAYGEIALVEEDALVVAANTPNIASRVGVRQTREQARLAWRAFDTRAPALVADYASWEGRQRVYDSIQIHAALNLPIFRDEKGIGVLTLGRAQPDYLFDAEQIRFGILFAQLAAVVLENSQLREALREQALRDPLTELYNRRYLQQWLERELQRVAHAQGTLGLILLDLDHFKTINDTYGHKAGDRVLQQVGAFLQNKLRGSDLACRYGGEEFILILRDTTLHITQRRADQIRAALASLALQFDSAPLPHLTVSMGVAAYPQNGATGDALIRCADAALYQAKQQGRNRIVAAS